MKRLYSQILFIWLFGLFLLSNSYIIPDPIAPLLYDKPYNNLKGNKMTLRFTFEESLPLNYNHFFGVSFPNNLSLTINQFQLPIVDTQNETKFDCLLKYFDGTNTKFVKVLPVLPSKTINKASGVVIEQTVLYCQVNDINYESLPIG